MTLEGLYKLFANHPEGLWIVEWPFAQRLYQFVKENQIKTVLDLGCGIGCSASVMALALKEKGVDYEIDSVEQYDKCIKLANELIPEELKRGIKVHKSEAKMWYSDKVPYQPFSVYETLPEGDYDLIINDGPAPWREGHNYIDFPNGTITKMLLEDKLKPGTLIAWDKRHKALGLLERYFGENFYLLTKQSEAGFYALEKKDVPFHFADMELEVVEKLTPYFKGMEESKKAPSEVKE